MHGNYNKLKQLILKNENILVPCRPGPVPVFCSRALPPDILSAYRTSPTDIEAKRKVYIHISESPYVSVCVFCVSPSLSQGPSSSGAVLLQFPLSAESTRGRQTPNTELTMTTNWKPPLDADLQRKLNIRGNLNGLRSLKAATFTFSANDKTVLA